MSHLLKKHLEKKYGVTSEVSSREPFIPMTQSWIDLLDISHFSIVKPETGEKTLLYDDIHFDEKLKSLEHHVALTKEEVRDYYKIPIRTQEKLRSKAFKEDFDEADWIPALKVAGMASVTYPKKEFDKWFFKWRVYVSQHFKKGS